MTGFESEIKSLNDYYQVMKNMDSKWKGLANFCDLWLKLEICDSSSSDDFEKLLAIKPGDLPDHVQVLYTRWLKEYTPLQLEEVIANEVVELPIPEKLERDESLDNPLSELESVIASLDGKLQALREQHRAFTSKPRFCFAKASPEAMKSIDETYCLPAIYLEFLQRFSPIYVYLETKTFFQDLELFGAHQLLARQNGYAFIEGPQKPIESWDSNKIVIASHAGDPYALDLGRIKEGDCPIYWAEHGTGEWHWKKYSPSFISFLNKLNKSYRPK